VVYISFWFIQMILCWVGATYNKENTEALVFNSKETGLEVNADKTKYMAMSGDQNAGRSHNIRTGNCFLKVGNSSYFWKQP